MTRLEKVDLTLSIDAAEEARLLPLLQQRVLELRLQLAGLLGDGRLGPPLCVLLEGWDASGKGGAIRRLVAPLDPRHVRAVEFGPPSLAQRRHHFLYRFIGAMPGWGGMAVFDRTWYGRVLVERVESLATAAEVERAYGAIAEFERAFADEGGVLVKLWLEISDAEQLRRFERRSTDPLKRWKLTDEDWRNRARRSDYVEAAEEMFRRTDLPRARWRVVPAESKRYARTEVLRRVIAAVEKGMRHAGIEPLADGRDL